MRLSRFSLLAMVFVVTSAVAQEFPASTWRFGVFTQGGSGVNARRDVQMWSTLGLRVGHVVGRPFGGGATRTEFEFGSEIIPLERFFWKNNPPINGFAVNPVILKWNFVGNRNRRMTPFVLATGGLVVTGTNLPPGDTNTLNFTPGFGFGAHIYTKPRQAFTADVRAIHISNASLGHHNPGVNASVQVSVGYTWFK